MSQTETEALRDRYERRKAAVASDLYSPLNADVWQTIQERQRTMLQLLSSVGLKNFQDTKLVDVGCGDGRNLLGFLWLGFQARNLIGLELLEDRVAIASSKLPHGIVRPGDAVNADIPEGSQDVVFQSVVFSSLLDDAYQDKLANKMWSWLRPGGAVLWYDFTYNNPSNPDVRGVPMRRVRALFPLGRFTVRRVTLAPPIARRICRIHPNLYSVFNTVPALRTHVLCWIRKSAAETVK